MNEVAYIIIISILLCVLIGGGLALFFTFNTRNRKLKLDNIYQKKLTKEGFESMARAIDSINNNTGHSLMVAEYSIKIGKKLGLAEKDLEHLYFSALVHDIGNLNIAKRILTKKAIFTSEEYEAMKKHTINGVQILGTFNTYPEIINGAMYHHEWWDGNGYNNKLREETPLIARIIGMAEAYIAMTSNKAYKPAKNTEDTIIEIKKWTDSQFDPKVAKAMLNIINDERLSFE